MIAHAIMAKYLKISKLQYQLQLFLQGTIFNNQVYYDLLFILQAHKMKSWLLILGAVITLLNLPTSLAAKSSTYFTVSQKEHLKNGFTKERHSFNYTLLLIAICKIYCT
jgi:hypothetical protein